MTAANLHVGATQQTSKTSCKFYIKQDGAAILFPRGYGIYFREEIREEIRE